MRTIVFLSMLFFGLFFSCTPKKAPEWSGGFPKLYLTGKDTIIKDSCSLYDKTTVTGFTCEGKPYAREKMIPRGYISGHYLTTQGQELSKDSLVSLLKKAGSENLIPERKNIGWNMPWELLGWLFFIALALGILILLLWLLRELFHWLSRQKLGSHNNNQNQGLTAESGPAPGKPGPQGTWVPAGYMLLPSGAVVVPYNGIYLGTRGEKDCLGANIYPQNQTSETTSEAQESQKNAEKIPPATTM